MEELATERIAESRLPFLNQGKFQASIIWTTCKESYCCQNIQILMLSPKALGKPSLDKPIVVCKLKILPRSTVLTIKDMMRGKATIDFGLHIVDVCKPTVHTVGRKNPSKKG